MSNEKETRTEVLERLQYEAENELGEIQQKYERELKELTKSTAKARESAKDFNELDKVHRHFEWEIKQVEKRHNEDCREVQRRFFEKMKALL